MPAEALEIQMLDALELELAKVGTAPTSNWLTTTPPERQVGVPDANVPSPNLMSLYLQHVRTEVMTDGAGVASHGVRCTFAVWCCSSHAGPDGHRNMLKLLDDVRRVLRSAEPRFDELFKYGLNTGSFQFLGSEAYLKEGISAGAIEVSVEAELTHDGADLVSLDSQLEAALPRIYPFSSLPPVERSSTGIAARLEPPALVLESSVPGANKLLELRVEGSPTDLWFRTPDAVDWPYFKAEIACQIAPAGGTNATATMFAGIELGTHNQAAPFPAAPTNAVAQLRWNYGLARWELYSAVGDGVTPATVVELTGVPALVTGGGARARLIYDPHRQTLAALINGITGAEITDPALLPQFMNYGATALTSGIFVTTGSHGSASVLALFSVCHCKLYNTTSPGATLWY